MIISCWVVIRPFLRIIALHLFSEIRLVISIPPSVFTCLWFVSMLYSYILNSDHDRMFSTKFPTATKCLDLVFLFYFFLFSYILAVKKLVYHLRNEFNFFWDLSKCKLNWVACMKWMNIRSNQSHDEKSSVSAKIEAVKHLPAVVC